jgi:hypothetical protein
VAFAVVLDAESRLRVGQVQPGDDRADLVSDAMLEDGCRQAVANQDEPKSGLHGRLGSWRCQRQHVGQPPGSVPPNAAIVRVGGDRVRPQSANMQQGVYADDGVVQVAPASEVERGPDGRGRRDLVEHHHVGGL